MEEGVARGGGGWKAATRRIGRGSKESQAPEKKSREREDKVEWGLRSGMKRV